MPSTSHPETFEEINILIINLTNEVGDLKKKNEEFCRDVKDLKKSNDELKKEISIVKDKMEKLERDDSLNRSPQQTVSQNRTEKEKENLEAEEDEPTHFQEVFAIEEENESEAGTGTHQKPKLGRTKRILSQFSSLLQRTNSQTSSESNIYNTNNICMLAVSAAYQCSQNPILRTRGLMWMMALSLFVFLFMQVFLLSILEQDSAYPACTKIATVKLVKCVMDLILGLDNLDVNHVFL